VLWIVVALGAVAVVSLAIGAVREYLEKRRPLPPPVIEPFDAFAGGYPVPPSEGEVLPELAGVVKSETASADASPAMSGGTPA
jgi:NADH-quinone oxidoreductase subunit H